MYEIENKDIVIKGWENGIADNPYEGLYDMRNIDIGSVTGEAGVNMKTEVTQSQGAISAVTFTATNATNLFTYDGVVPLEVNTCITVVNAGGALPSGMAVNTAYYVKTIPSGTTFTLSSASAGGAELAIADDGTGTQSFSTIDIGKPITFEKATTDPFASSDKTMYFMLDNNGRCWVHDSITFGSTNKWIYMRSRSTEDLSSTLQQGRGLIYYKNYLFVFTKTTISVMWLDNITVGSISLALITTLANWTRSWQTITSTDTHEAIVSKGDLVYFCNHHYLGSIDEPEDYVFSLAELATVADGVTTSGDGTITTVTAFFVDNMLGAEIVGVGIPSGARIGSITNSKEAELAVGDEATINDTGVTFTVPAGYAFTASALFLPNDIATCIAELNGYVLTGGVENVIYPWDRLSTTYDYPIRLSENYISKLVTVNTTTYIFAGRRGNIYQTNGGNVSYFKTIPIFLSETYNPIIRFQDAIFNRNHLYFSFTAQENDGTDIDEYGGIWAIDLKSGGMYLANQLSYATYAGYASALFPFNGDVSSASATSVYNEFGTNQGTGLFAGWYDGTSYNIDISDEDPYSSGESYVVSDMIPTGQIWTKRTFENIEYKLATPLVTGESVALYYRQNITEAFTQIPITQGGAVGDLSGIAGVTNFENVQWIQIKAVLTSTNTTPSFVRLREIRIR